MFSIKGLAIQITIDLPERDSFGKTDKGRVRKQSQADVAYGQAVRQRWRSLVLMVKAKLVAIEDGITTVEKEFLSFIVLPEGITIGEKLVPQIKKMAETGTVPKLLGFAQ